MSGQALSANLESPLPDSLPPGTAVALYCSGTAWVGEDQVRSLELLLGDAARAPAAARMPRFDMPCRRSGFWGVIPFTSPEAPGEVQLRARVGGREGSAREVTLGRIPIVAALTATSRGPASPGLVAICMATFDPDPGLLRAQLDSIRAQTDGNWICVISDDCSSPDRYGDLGALVGEDPRFVLSRSERRIGFYRNFERALRMAPAQAELIALCDQDDVWHADKLAVLRGSLGSAMLVYSDLRLIDAHGRVLRETLWRGRANNSSNLASMLVANSVTGASALFRREVADRALPFPDSPGIEFHDHWIALVALASGELAYVDRPLYDYVQHAGAILGKVAVPAAGAAAGWPSSGPPGRSRGPARTGRPGRWRRPRLPQMRAWRAAYFLGYVPGEIRAQTLLLRCAEDLTPPKRRALQRYLASASSPLWFAWFVLRPLRALAGRSETLGGEWELARGIVWLAMARMLADAGERWPQRLLLDTRFPDPPRFEHRRLRRWRARV